MQQGFPQEKKHRKSLAVGLTGFNTRKHQFVVDKTCNSTASLIRLSPLNSTWSTQGKSSFSLARLVQTAIRFCNITDAVNQTIIDVENAKIVERRGFNS